MRRLNKVAAGALTLFLLLAIAAVLTEAGSFAALRYLVVRELHKRSPAEALAVYQQSWGAELWREQRQVVQWTYAPFLQRKTKPFAGVWIHVDKDGIRRTLGSRCDAMAPVVWVFGGSTVWGYGNPDATTIPSLLASEYERRGRPACVVNYGENAWTTTQGVVKLMLELKRTARTPDVVIFINGCNDLITPFLVTGDPALEADYVQSRAALDSLLTAGRGTWGWLQLTNTSMFAKRIVQRLQSGNGEPLVTNPGLLARKVVRNYVQNMRLVAGAGAAFKFRAEFYWQPMAMAGVKPLTAEEKQSLMRSAFHDEATGARRVVPLLRSVTDPHFHDLSSVFDNVRESVYIDECHLQPAGNRILARRIADDLLPGR